MHDPMSIAFEFGPFTVWHVDPEKGGDSDSCFRGRPTRWNGWRLHFWHWRIRCSWIRDLKRWLWSRCAECGRRFPFGYAPISLQWDDAGPRWFRGEECVYHHGCNLKVDL